MNWLKALLGIESKPKNLSVAPDFIWVTAQGKRNGIAEALNRLAVKNPVAVLLVAHFDDTFSLLQAIHEAHESPIPIMAIRASELNSEIASKFQTDESQTLAVLVAERHPLLTEDDRIIHDFAVALDCKCEVQFHISLDDVIMRPMASPQVREMLSKLGMRDDDCISSGMVARRVRNFQQQLAKKATGNRPASTAAEWLELNT